MNVFQKYTRQSLRKNRTRTLVTVIGIVLSMALLTAVIEGAYSGLQFLLRGEAYSAGAYHAAVHDLSVDELAALKQERELQEINVWQQVGWADIDSRDRDKPYILIADLQQTEPQLVAIHLTDGRMPEREDELLLPTHLSQNGEVEYALGQSLRLQVGRRTVAGSAAAQNDSFAWGEEAIENTTEKTYTVVGFYERLPSTVEAYECPGYTALTCGGGSGSYSAFFTLQHPGRAYQTLQTFSYGSGVTPHTYILSFYGSLRNPGLAGVLYGMVAILVGLIAFGSISLIYNSFSISVSERTRQYGILKSVGATNKQVRGSVLYEALLLCAIGIPIGLLVGCGGIGLTLYLLRDAFRLFVQSDHAPQMQLVLSVPALAISAALCLLTTLISAWIPAIRAVRITPIQAIRQSADLKLSRHDVRTSGLTQRLFGFAGTMAAKSFRRNRKQYRSTILSLFLSVTLFIAASSFSAYLTDSVEASLGGSNLQYDIWYADAAVTEQGSAAADRLQSQLRQIDHVTDVVYAMDYLETLTYQAEGLTAACLQLPIVNSEAVELTSRLCFVQDSAFRELCRQQGLNPETYFDESDPQSIMVNHATGRYWSEASNADRFMDYDVFSPSALPATVTLYHRETFLDGYELESEDGEFFYYYPEEDLHNYWSGEEETLDESKAMILTREQATTQIRLKVTALIHERPWYCSADTRPTLIYPYSMIANVMPQELQNDLTDYYFQTDNHSAAFSELRKLTDGKLMQDYAEEVANMRMSVTVVNVFAYGFIILISLIAVANVFNTVSTGIYLRRREFAMLQSIGMGARDFYRMMNYESLIYGMKALLWGVPAAFALTWLIYRVVSGAIDRSFYVPWYSIAIAVGSVFLVVFATMLYSARRIRRENLIDALKTETL